MSRARVLVLIIAFITIPAAASGQSDSTAIERVIRDVAEANNAGDVERWVGLFAPDFVYMAPGAPAVTSREELVGVARTGFRNKASIEIRPLEIRVAGAWAYARNAVTGSVTIAGSGRQVAVNVKQLAIYVRTPNGWRISRLMMNSDNP